MKDRPDPKDPKYHAGTYKFDHVAFDNDCDEWMDWAEAEIRRLQKIVIEKTMQDPPCNVCGHNGPGYYQPKTHPCAAIWHKREEGDTE